MVEHHSRRPGSSSISTTTFCGYCISDDYVTTSCAHSDQSGQSTSIYDQMEDDGLHYRDARLGDQQRDGARVRQRQPRPDDVRRDRDTRSVDTRPSDCNGQASCFYIFADTRDAGSASNISATFTTVGNSSGPIPVVGESRSITATNGTFSDTFALGSTVHVYGPIPNQ